MTPDERSFIDAAIQYDLAAYHYEVASQAARKGFTRGCLIPQEEFVAAYRAQERAAAVQYFASIDLDMARKRVTDPHIPK